MNFRFCFVSIICITSVRLRSPLDVDWRLLILGQEVEIRCDGGNLSSPVPFVLMVIGFEMYRGVRVDDMISELQGQPGSNVCVVIPFGKDSSELGPFTQSFCPLKPVALFKITKLFPDRGRTASVSRTTSIGQSVRAASKCCE